MIEDRMFPMLENMLTLTSKRQQALAANIANLDTPGYRAKDYSFEAEMDTIRMSGTSDKHIAPPAPDARFRTFEVGTAEKPNGNTVDLDREMTEMTKNGLEYLTLVQYLNHKLRTLRSSISEGGKV
jgi:flagellar basal-body rod protein FlgB